LLTVIAIALAIIVAAPQYAEPAFAGDEPAVESAAPSLDPTADIVHVFHPVVPTSKEPGELRGYKWPVTGGGQVHAWFDYDPKGVFEVDGKRIHDGIVITWFEGAPVRAAHRGTVVAAGRDWARNVGFRKPPDELYKRHAKGGGSKSKKPVFPLGVVIDDGNDYYSVYTELKDLQVEQGQKVKAGQIIGRMAAAEGKQMMRYRLVRMDGDWMRVSDPARAKGYPDYARERIDPLAVLDKNAKRRPKTPNKPPRNPPRQSDY
jgi:murein DD-endopeptidase MepM/ murein hydrolase activator NlpD